MTEDCGIWPVFSRNYLAILDMDEIDDYRLTPLDVAAGAQHPLQGGGDYQAWGGGSASVHRTISCQTAPKPKGTLVHQVLHERCERRYCLLTLSYLSLSSTCWTSSRLDLELELLT